MTDPGPATAQAEVTIDADPDTVYHLITDLSTLASLAEEAETMAKLAELGVTAAPDPLG